MKEIGKFLLKWLIFNIGIIIIAFATVNIITKWNTSMTLGNSIGNVVGIISLFTLGIIAKIVGLVI